MVVIAVFGFVLTADTSLANKEKASDNDRFVPGRVFFQHVNVARDDYIRKLQATIADASLVSSARAIARCELFLLTEDPVSARFAVEREMLKYESPEIANIACRCAMRCGDFSRGEQICRTVLAAHPDNTDAHLMWAMISSSITPELQEIVNVDCYGWIVKGSCPNCAQQGTQNFCN